MAAPHWNDLASESFQGLLLRHRGRTRLTQRQLAARVGVSRGSIQDWESGLTYPDAHHLQALIVAFLEAGGFVHGIEADEVETLWAAAIRQAPRMQTPFDVNWWVEILSRRAVIVSREHVSGSSSHVDIAASANGSSSERRQDWGEAPAVVSFQGRADELSLLRDWILIERCRVAAVLGIGGIGKTILAARLAQDIAPSFRRVYWRSLRDALPFGEWVTGAIAFVSGNNVAPPEGEPAQRAVLLRLLHELPSLLVLDNFETLLDPGRRDGKYRDGYDGYGRLLQAIGEGRHESCLLLTSREAPQELVLLPPGAERTLHLGGLGATEAQILLADKQLVGSSRDWLQLVDRVGGNGLALKVVGESIREVFGGDIGAFLGMSGPETVFEGLGRLLDGQLQRGSTLEQSVLRALAVEREPMTVGALIDALSPRVGRGAVLQAVESLRRRSLIEHTELEGSAAFTMQSVVLEYVTDSLVREISYEIENGAQVQLVAQPVIQAQAKDYVRQTQERLIGEAILSRLETNLGANGAERRLVALLDRWRERPFAEHGFGPGNLINLLRIQRGELRGLNLAGLAIRQAYLAGVEAHDTTLVDSELIQPVLAEEFTHATAVALSGDGALVAAGTSTGQVYLWRTACRMRLLTIEAHSGSVHGLALTQDGRTLASGGDDGRVRVWNAMTGASIATLHAHTGPVFDVALAPDGRLLASGGDDRTVRLWDTTSGQLLVTAEGHSGPVHGVALSADGQLFASASEDGSVRLWRVANGRSAGIFVGHSGPTYGVALSADGRLLASGGLDGTVRLWTTDASQAVATLAAHSSGVWRVALSPDGKLLASGSWDGTVRLWEMARATPTAQPLSTPQSRGAAVYGVALSANNRRLANGSEDGTVRIWDVASGRLLRTLQGDTSAMRGVAMSDDGAVVFTAGFDGTVRLWDMSTAGQAGVLRGYTGTSGGVALSSRGRLFASGGQDGSITLWDASTLRSVSVLQGHIGAVYALALEPEGRLLASGGLDRTVRLWDARRGRLVATLEGHSRAVWTVALPSAASIVASGSLDGSIHLWDVTTGRLLSTLEQNAGAIFGIAFSSDGHLLASSARDGSIGLWDVHVGKLNATLRGHAGPVYAVALTPDGRLLASGGLDGTVRLWDVGGGGPPSVLRKHTGPVYSVALDAAGRQLVSVGLDGAVVLWDLANGTPPRSLRIDRRYERVDITGLTGITSEQRAAMLALGAVDRRLSTHVEDHLRVVPAQPAPATAGQLAKPSTGRRDD